MSTVATTFLSVDDPKWHAFYGLLQVNAHIVERVGAAMERETGLPPSWFEVLANLSKGPLRMSDLAAQLTLSRGGATRLIARMEDEGLVEREIPKTDRRATYARLTDKGVEALHAGQARALRDRRGDVEPPPRRRAGRGAARPPSRRSCAATASPAQTRRRSTSAPAGSGPEPCGATAKPSLSPSAPVMCEPWRSVG